MSCNDEGVYCLLDSGEYFFCCADAMKHFRSPDVADA
jgi:hypothetical protein